VYTRRMSFYVHASGFHDVGSTYVSYVRILEMKT